MTRTEAECMRDLPERASTPASGGSPGHVIGHEGQLRRPHGESERFVRASRAGSVLRRVRCRERTEICAEGAHFVFVSSVSRHVHVAEAAHRSRSTRSKVRAASSTIGCAAETESPGRRSGT